MVIRHESLTMLASHKKMLLFFSLSIDTCFCADSLIMGGAVSAGQNNDELVDNLCHEDYIQTPEVEMVHPLV